MTEVRLISWNVNGIRAVHKKGFLDWFDKEETDVLCLQETKAHLEQLPKKLVNVSGYQSYFHSAERKGYSGVATYTSIEPNEVFEGMGIEKFDVEGRLQRLDFDEFTLLNIYYPNGGRDDERLRYKLDFYDAFLEYANDLRDQGFNLVICGDLNTAHKPIDLARPAANELKGNGSLSSWIMDMSIPLECFIQMRRTSTAGGVTEPVQESEMWDGDWITSLSMRNSKTR